MLRDDDEEDEERWRGIRTRGEEKKVKTGGTYRDRDDLRWRW